MEYKGSYGKTVKVLVDNDGWGKPVSKGKTYVVTRYMDSDAGTVGIYPLQNGESVDDILSTQPMSNEVYVKDLTEV